MRKILLIVTVMMLFMFVSCTLSTEDIETTKSLSTNTNSTEIVTSIYSDRLNDIYSKSFGYNYYEGEYTKIIYNNKLYGIAYTRDKEEPFVDSLANVFTYYIYSFDLTTEEFVIEYFDASYEEMGYRSIFIKNDIVYLSMYYVTDPEIEDEDERITAAVLTFDLEFNLLSFDAIDILELNLLGQIAVNDTGEICIYESRSNKVIIFDSQMNILQNITFDVEIRLDTIAVDGTNFVLGGHRPYNNDGGLTFSRHDDSYLVKVNALEGLIFETHIDKVDGGDEAIKIVVKDDCYIVLGESENYGYYKAIVSKSGIQEQLLINDRMRVNGVQNMFSVGDKYIFFVTTYDSELKRVRYIGYLCDEDLSVLEEIEVYENNNYNPYVYSNGKIYSIKYINSEIKIAQNRIRIYELDLTL